MRARRAHRSSGLPLAMAVALIVVAVAAGPTLWARTVERSRFAGDVVAAIGAPGAAARPADINPAPTGPAPAGPTPTTAASAAASEAAAEDPSPTLPVPEPLPADAYADTPEVVVGRIEIPAIGLDADLGSGMTLTAINRGPSHWPGTALPGRLGNVVVAGHRTTFTRPFHDLDRLQPGDLVRYRTDGATFTYAVTATEVVEPEAVRIADQTVAYTSTLFACHPPGSAAYRIVVHLQLLDDAGIPVQPPPAVAYRIAPPALAAV